jgi:hypothetical protein
MNRIVVENLRKDFFTLRSGRIRAVRWVDFDRERVMGFERAEGHRIPRDPVRKGATT